MLGMYQYYLKIIIEEYYGISNLLAKVQKNNDGRAYFKNFLMYMY